MPVKSRRARFTIDSRSASGTHVAVGLRSLFLTLTFVLMLPASAMAYVGPGAGVTLVGALWAVIVAIVLMGGGLLAWPLRVFLRRRKNARPKKAPQTGA